MARGADLRRRRANRPRLWCALWEGTGPPPREWWLARPGIDQVRAQDGAWYSRPRAVYGERPERRAPDPAKVNAVRQLDLEQFLKRAEAAAAQAGRQADREAAHEARRAQHRAVALAGGGKREGRRGG